MTTCEQCGLTYIPDHKPDEKEHKKHHAKWLKACTKFGLLLPYHQRERLKHVSAHEAEDKETSDMLMYWAWFCRSVQGSGYNLNHISFPEYIEFLKNQDFEKELTKEEYLRSGPTTYAPIPKKKEK